MSTAVLERSVAPARGDGGRPARRAIVRWAWRLFRREWRRQALILVLLILAVGATTIGLGIASNASELKADPTFGTANTVITLSASDTNVASDIAALQGRFGTIDVIAHQNVAVPGSVSAVDLRAQNPNGPYGHVALRLDAGRYPTGPDQVAVSSNVAKTFGLHVGSAWSEGGRTRQVVGQVENPLNLSDQFALVAPGQANPPADVSILVNANRNSLQSLRLPSGTDLSIGSRGGGNNKTGSEVIVLVLGSLGLLFVGLMSVAGFTVIAQRRLRALGMLGALGATDRQVRLVMLANGAAVGASGAVLGTVTGLAAWFAFVPSLESLAQHRIDRFALPWWAIAAAMILTLVTAVGAAWWPARAVARIPVVAALSGRPPRPQPAHRFAALGGMLLATGLVLLAFADQNRSGFIVAGTVTTVVGLLLLAPLAIQALAAAGRHSRISVRLALRDLARYQARSGAALGAVTLAVGIAATIAVSAAAATTPTAAGNLPASDLVLYLTPGGSGNPIPPLTTAQQHTLQTGTDHLSAALHSQAVLPLAQAFDPTSGLQTGGPGPGGGPAGYMTASLARVIQQSRGESVSQMETLYVATPALLARYGIKPSDINPGTDIVSSRSDLGGLQIFDPGVRQFGSGGAAPSGPGQVNQPVEVTHPTIQILRQLPIYSSAPTTLITSHAMRALGLQAIPAGWLVQTAHALTTAQIGTAQKAAAAAGLYVETKTVPKSLAPLRNWSTAAGILLALGVLGMTVGLIRSETANDLRTLTATGASSTTRRTLTGATAGALAFLGAVLGTAGAYVALLAWHRSNLDPLGRVPVVDLIVIVIGLPLVATVGGWLLAGRQPPALARQPLE